MKFESYDLLVSKHAELSSITAKCAGENRSPSAEEAEHLNVLKSDIDAIRSEWESAGRQAFLSSLSFVKKEQRGQTVLKAEDSMAKHLEGTYPQEFKHLSLGKILRGYITGEWAGADLEQKAMASTPTSAGGILIPVPLAADVVDLARNQSRVLQARAITVPMSSATLRYARLDSDVQPAWTAEAANIALSAASFDSVVFTAHKLALIVAIDNELLKMPKTRTRPFRSPSARASRSRSTTRVCTVPASRPSRSVCTATCKRLRQAAPRLMTSCFPPCSLWKPQTSPRMRSFTARARQQPWRS